jgi:hypothetical protein
MDLNDTYEKVVEERKRVMQFFLEAGEKSKGFLAKMIFSEFALEEGSHIRAINEFTIGIKKEKLKEKPIPHIVEPSRFKEIFKECLREEISSFADEMEFLYLGLKKKEESIKYYESLANKATDLRKKQCFLNITISEIQNVLKLIDIIECLNETLTNKEKGL